MRFNADDGQWHWVEQDLSEYQGQRVEFEFSPAGNAPLAVAKIVESDHQPTDPLTGRFNPLVLQACSVPGVVSVEALARSYQGLFSAIADDLASDKIVGSRDADARAAPGRLAGAPSRLVQRRRLFRPGNTSPPPRARPPTGEAELIKQVKTESRTAPAMFDGNGVDENVLVRGVAKNTGDLVPRRFLEAIAGADQSPYPADSSGRLRLAHDILSTG